MNQFYVTTFIVFGLWKTLSLTLHFFSASPWGGRLVTEPDRLLPEALLVELGLLAATCIAVGLLETLIRSARAVQVWRAAFLLSACMYFTFTQADQEAVRWLGQHVSVSYLRNYYSGVPDSVLTKRIFSGDIFWSGVALLLVTLTPIFAYATWRHSGDSENRLRRASMIGLTVFMVLSVTSSQWIRPSAARWRRVKPAVLSMTQEAYLSFAGKEKALNPQRASGDLAALVRNKPLPDTEDEHAEIPYPLWRDDNVGQLSVSEFKALPIEERPDIVFIVAETLRAWSTGLIDHPEFHEGTPQLNRWIQDESAYFPYTHSAGFPSIEGATGTHLGIWPHFRKIILSDYTHIRSKAFPEILSEFGYNTHALLGADPAFSNFTPWFERWYDAWEYNPAVHHDGPLVDRFIERYDAYEGSDPRMMMVWTATMHVSYDLPKSENVQMAVELEDRYKQAIRYTDGHIARLLEHLKAQPNWDRTVVVIVGDHGQATPEQLKMTDTIGHLTSAHTWTVLSILGGWSGLPKAQRFEFDVSHVDIAPTLLSLLNVRAPNHFMGRDLFRLDPEQALKSPLLTFRHGDIVRQQGGDRVHFRLDSDSVHHMRFARSSPLAYGSLPGGEWALSSSAPEGWELDRWRDMTRYYAQLLDENGLMPPPAESEVANPTTSD